MEVVTGLGTCMMGAPLQRIDNGLRRRTVEWNVWKYSRDGRRTGHQQKEKERGEATFSSELPTSRLV